MGSMDYHPDISVVIPVFNRFKILRRTLLALNNQSMSSDCFEVILVDDGSDEDIHQFVNEEELSYPIMILRQNHLGPAAARNRGANIAKGRVILFLDNDMIASMVLLEQHSVNHKGEAKRIVVGSRSLFNEAGIPDAFARFDYLPDGSDLRLKRQPISFQEVFTCNLSLRRDDWMILGGFNEKFTTASFEDIEFAYRAHLQGYKFFWNPEALAYHDHLQTLEDRCRRAVSYTMTVPLLYRLHPELRGKINYLLDKEPIDFSRDLPRLLLKKLLRRLLALSPILQSQIWLFKKIQHNNRFERLERFLYWKIIGSYQLKGLQEGFRQYAKN